MKSMAIYKRLCCSQEFYKHSYSILLLLSSDFYNLVPREIKTDTTWNSMSVIYLKLIYSGYTAICFVIYKYYQASKRWEIAGGKSYGVYIRENMCCLELYKHMEVRGHDI
jgi:hypothetical protein